jgi:hypothetical protein
LYGTGFDDALVRRIGRLNALEGLALEGTEISDESLRVISRFQTLKYLTLTDTAVTAAGLRELASLPLLEVLNISHCDRLHGDVAEVITSLRSLKYCICNNTGVEIGALEWSGLSTGNVDPNMYYFLSRVTAAQMEPLPE